MFILINKSEASTHKQSFYINNITIKYIWNTKKKKNIDIMKPDLLSFQPNVLALRWFNGLMCYYYKQKSIQM